ncbi:basic proline-rich protein-like [Penaeus monodon]|uniref:basic proline-rich protein-like n=1 Tax=Penaeus monodon TaxID=6687 RepID=UPI0018A7C1C4|nr:basic proline-rich protein-like [Penaeus monodon]
MAARSESPFSAAPTRRRSRPRDFRRSDPPRGVSPAPARPIPGTRADTQNSRRVPDPRAPGPDPPPDRFPRPIAKSPDWGFPPDRKFFRGSPDPFPAGPPPIARPPTARGPTPGVSPPGPAPPFPPGLSRDPADDRGFGATNSPIPDVSGVFPRPWAPGSGPGETPVFPDPRSGNPDPRPRRRSRPDPRDAVLGLFAAPRSAPPSIPGDFPPRVPAPAGAPPFFPGTQPPPPRDPPRVSDRRRFAKPANGNRPPAPPPGIIDAPPDPGDFDPERRPTIRPGPRARSIGSADPDPPGNSPLAGEPRDFPPPWSPRSRFPR